MKQVFTNTWAYSGIYVIRNIVNGKVYIGSSSNIQSRLHHHRKKLNKNQHDNPHLQNAWIFYGEDYFRFDVLEFVPIATLLVKEKEYIEKYKACDRNFGYNNVPNPLRHSPTPEMIEKIRIANTGKKRSDAIRLRMSIERTGFKHSNQTKEKCRLAGRKNTAPKSLKHKENIAKFYLKNCTYPNFHLISKEELLNLISKYDSLRKCSQEIHISYETLLRYCKKREIYNEWKRIQIQENT